MYPLNTLRRKLMGLAIATITLVAAVITEPALCDNPGSSQNIDLFSQLTPSQLGSGFATDCWGYTSPSGREYAIVCLEDKTAVVEITNPTSPIIVGSVSHAASSTGDVKVYLDYAYAANGNSGGIDIIDLSDVDNGNVSLVQRMTTGGVQWVHNVFINEESGYLYLGIGNINTGDLVAYNLANPEAPFVDGQYNGGRSHDLHVITYTQGPYAGREIAFSFSESRGVDIIDVTDKGNMFLRSRRTYPNTQYCHQGWVSEDRQYLYLNDELDGVQRTTVFDISNLDDPVHVNDFSASEDATDHNLYIRDGFIYEANYSSGLRVFDARTNPTNPPEVGFYDTSPASGEGFSGAWSNFPFFPSGTVIVSDRSGGLFVLDVSAIIVEPVVPDSFLVTRGEYISGNESDLAASDDLDLTLRRLGTDVQSRTEFEVMAISPTASPSSLEVTLEGSVFARSTVVQTIELWDYVASTWELVDTRNATNMTDSTAIVAATGDLSRFVDQTTLSVEARIHFQSPVPRQRFASNVDQFIWTIK